MTMNKYQEAQLVLIENLLPKIQEFVNKNIVGEKTMTAAAVAEQFLKANPHKISIDDFVKSFRIAVGEGKITGIEGAKRAGYRRIGASRTNAVDAIVNSFMPYAADVQALIDKHIRGRNKLTSQAIYQKFLGESGGNCKLNEEDFIKGFRAALSKGKLTGIVGAGPYGYKHIDESEASDEEEESEEVESVPEIGASGCEIIIDNTHKIVALDDRNWGYQIKKGVTWTNTGYFCNCRAMVSSIAKRMLDERLKTMDGFNFDQLEDRIAKAEANITDLLLKAISASVARKQENAKIQEEVCESQS